MTASIFQQFSKGNGNPDADPMIWGGKGAGLAKMAGQGYPVPPGFTISTDLCKAYNNPEIGPEAVMDAVMADIDDHLAFVEKQIGFMPLLSVRSGAPVSMPGMMDTILNVGAYCDDVDVSWLDHRTLTDSTRRLLQMMGSTALGLDHAKFEAEMVRARTKASVETDAELTAEHLEGVIGRFEEIYKEAGVKIPTTQKEQLRACIDAVFRSWMCDNAIEYRRIENIDEAMGTAVTVQAMVFGNMNDKSGSGVLFTRNPSTGEKKIFAEYLTNAQGEDVVAGIRTPEVLELAAYSAATNQVAWQDELAQLCVKLEQDYRDMVDAEFTVQDGELFMLQSRVGKRSAQAAFRIALDLRNEGVLEEQEMFKRVKRKHLLTVRRPSIDPKFKDKPKWTGIAGSMGIATGIVAKSSEEAVGMAATGHKVVLVTEETTPDDIAGMAASVGILTRTGGATSHAAVVARGMDKPCVVGCTDLDMEQVATGSLISIDGATGRVWPGAVPVTGGTLTADVQEFLDRLLEAEGVVPLNSKPMPGGAVALAEWLDLEDAAIKERVALAKDLLDEGGELMFDITAPHKFGDDPDEEIWSIAGTPPEEDRYVSRVMHVVLHGGLTKAKIIGGTADQRELFLMKGFGVLPTATTLTELVTASGMVCVDPAMSQFLGADGLKLLREKGMFKGKVIAGSLPQAYAALQLMGE